MPGYDTVAVTIDGGDGKHKDYKFLLSKDRYTLLRVTKFDLTKDPFAELMSKIDVKGRPSRGAKSAKVVVVNFDDFECPFCSRMHSTLFPEILQGIWRPRDFHLQGLSAGGHSSVGDPCRGGCQLPGDQNDDAYWDFADYIHANKAEVDSEKRPRCAIRLSLDKMAMLQGQKAQSRCWRSCRPASKRRTKTRSALP